MNPKTARAPRSTLTPQNNPAPAVEKPIDLSQYMPKNAVIPDIEMDTCAVVGIDIMLQAKYGQTLETMPKHVAALNTRMLEYIQLMGPASYISSPEIGARNQQYLVNTILKALSQHDKNELLMAMDIVLWHMHQEREGVFRSEAVYRYLTIIDRQVDVVEDYTKFIEIFLRLADPAARSAQAQSGDIRKALTLIKQQHLEAAANIVIYLTQY